MLLTQFSLHISSIKESYKVKCKVKEDTKVKGDDIWKNVMEINVVDVSEDSQCGFCVVSGILS
jgi:hypothetical protein